MRCCDNLLKASAALRPLANLRFFRDVWIQWTLPMRISSRVRTRSMIEDEGDSNGEYEFAEVASFFQADFFADG
jgi:hypothetical protein